MSTCNLPSLDRDIHEPDIGELNDDERRVELLAKHPVIGAAACGAKAMSASIGAAACLLGPGRLRGHDVAASS